VPAHPGKRLLARLLDTLILAAFFVVLYAIGLGDGAFHTITRSDGTQELLIDQGKLAQLTIATGLLGFIYEWLFIAFKGQTLGKMAAGVKVVRAENGMPLGLGKAFIRQMVPAVPGLIPRLGWILELVVYLSIFLDRTKRYQGWHDKAAGDFVIKSR
jgi:uncharacterized RDD family membrane protein YckC